MASARESDGTARSAKDDERYAIVLAGTFNEELALRILEQVHARLQVRAPVELHVILAINDAPAADRLVAWVESGRGIATRADAPIDFAMSAEWLAEASGGMLDAVVCCFQRIDPVALDRCSLPEWRASRRINARASWLLARATVPLLRRRTGSFVALTSRAAQEAVPGAGAFGPSKVMEAMMLRNVAVEALPQGVRVNLVRQSPRPDTWTIGTVETATDVANAIGFLLSDEARSINAVILPVDGGTATAASTQTQFAIPLACDGPIAIAERGPRLRAVITGGAGQIGLASAAALHRQAISDGLDGLSVILADRDVASLGLAEVRLRDLGVEVVTMVADLEQDDTPAMLVRQAVELFGGLDLIHSNAALGLNDTALGADLETYERILSINLDSTWRFACEGVEHLARSHGSLIATSSIASLNANGRAPLYAASKAGLTMLMTQLALEWAPRGMRANVVCPGSIDTPMNQLSALPPEQRDAIVAGFPSRRMGTAAEIGAAVAFLASRGASYVTGQNIVVDGGLANALR